MIESRNHLPRDLTALRYLDALTSRDLVTVAALWEEASRDPELERILSELDAALFVEVAGTNWKAGAERVRGHLPKNLTSDSPAPRPPATLRRWGRWVGVLGALAAACLLAVLAWLGRDSTKRIPDPGSIEPPPSITRQPPDDSGWLALRGHNDVETFTFSWPLEQTSPVRASISIPPDLLD